MPSQKIVVGPLNKGLRNDVTPFNVDNDSFPTLINAYQWRGRVKRKRGTELLGRLTRFFNSLNAQFNPGTTTQALVAGAGNLLTGFANSGIQSSANIVPGTVTIHDQTTSTTYTDPSMNGTLSGGAGGTINYASGAITISGGGTDTIDANFNYYPNLPVLGLEPFVNDNSSFPIEIGFDETYSYNISVSFPYTINNVSFYLNPAVPPGGIFPGYVPKTSWTPLNWNLQNYQQVWTTNYQGAMWQADGITDTSSSPSAVSNIGMQYKFITTVNNITSGPPALADLTINAHGLVVGDFVFINEVATTTGINFQTGYVVQVYNANKVQVEFPLATIANNGTGGIAQYLTNNSDTTKDCLRWYNGSPVSSAIPPAFSRGAGWVNFAPPLISGPGSHLSIEDLPVGQYYLVGARIIIPFKDRILFFGPVIQTSAAGSQVYLQDTVIYSQNGTPYYTCSFAYSTVVPSPSIIPTTTFLPMLLPTNQTAQPSAFWEDVTGYGGNQTAGYSRPITSVSPNEDSLIVGFADRQARLLYTSNDIIPFNFYIINSELGSDSTFSAITLDRGVLSVGGRGIIITSQTESARIDIEIPDQVFEISLLNAGSRRVCAQRDFINEWIYFTYVADGALNIYPTQTLQYNYRDQSWAVFNECYTTYGTIRKQTGYTWANVGLDFPTWESWSQPWNYGTTNLLQPVVIAGNQQGFVIVRGSGTAEEGASLYIQGISGSVITSPNHCLREGDYIVINGVLGTIGSEVNGNIFSVSNPTTTTFTLNPLIAGTGTYLGGGTITRMYVPQIQTRQFPVSWEMARKTRIGPQQYLFSTTANGQITLQIFLSQNAASAYNAGSIIPSDTSINDTLIYSNILYTCPELTNLGLTPANINLQMPTASQQAQIWHRENTSLLGDTVQIGFTLSDAQMRDTTFSNQFAEIELHSLILDCSASQLLA